MVHSTLRPMGGSGVGSCLLCCLAWGHINLEWFSQIHAGHDVLDCQYRHKFSDSNVWIALANVPPKQLHWPLCTGWTLGWCRTPPMPVSVQSYGCCPVVIYRCSTLYHTQCNRSPAWSEQWPGTASEVCLSPTHFKWVTTRMSLRASLHCVFRTLMCFLNERCESQHSPMNLIDYSTGRRVLPILVAGVLWVLDRGIVKCMTL